MTKGVQHSRGCAAWQGVCGMAGGVPHEVGSSTLSFRALVAESSHCGIQPFCCHFLYAATARSMTGGVTQHGGGITQHGGGCSAGRH